MRGAEEAAKRAFDELEKGAASARAAAAKEGGEGWEESTLDMDLATKIASKVP